MKYHNYEKEISKLRAWASELGLRVTTTKGYSDEEIEIFPDMIEPFFGNFSFNPPPSYRSFLKKYGSLCIEYDCNEKNDDEPDWILLPDGLNISSIDEIIDHRGFVFIPEHVSNNSEKGYITTNHLLGFSGTDSDFHWCFITDRPDQNSELPVIYHCADELNAARYINTGEYLNPELSIDYQSFYEWFTKQTDRICKLKWDDILDEDMFEP